MRRILACAAIVGAMLMLQPLPDGALADSPKVEIPFGTLVRDSSCPVATHLVRHPCPPYDPIVFVVFPQGKNVSRYEGQNVSLRGTVDETACSLPLVQATRVTVTPVLPPCPAEQGG